LGLALALLLTSYTPTQLSYLKPGHMKKILICAAILFAAAFLNSTSAQTRVKSNISIQPKWAPKGNDYVAYYYLPDIDTYYYVPRKQFIYQTGNYWTFSSSLPAASKNFDLYSANKVVINEAGAYRFNAQHKAKYGSNNAKAETASAKEKLGG
jgi:hypothetical protein